MMERQPTFNIRVYGLLINDNRLLVSDEFIRGAFITKLPGGGLEFGEGTIDCLKREFKEETGLEVAITEHFYTTDFFQISAFNNIDQIISIYYKVSCNNLQSLSISNMPFNFQPHQIADKTQCAEVFRWIDLSQLQPENLTLPIDKKVIELLLLNN